MKASYHTHTPHCGHALGNSTAEYAKAAYEEGIEILGFSDHCPFKDVDLGYRMKYETLPVYLKEVDELKTQYEGKMKILKAVEVEYLPTYDKTGSSFYEYLLNELKLDYLLLGEHFYEDRNGKRFNLYNISGSEDIVEYALACKKAMDTGYFKMLAHPDLFGVNDYVWDTNMEKATDIIIEAAIKNETILEYNANGFRRGVKSFSDGERFMYPLGNFWKKVSETDVKVIIGSDSHNPKEIWDYVMPKAQDELKKLGIRFLETI